MGQQQCKEENTATISQWSYTNVKMSKCEYAWIIADFDACVTSQSTLGANNRSITSQQFQCDGDNWCLELTWDQQPANSISLQLRLQGNCARNAQIKYSFYVINAENQKRRLNCANNVGLLTANQQVFRLSNVMTQEFIREPSNGMLRSDGSLVILCQMEVCGALQHQAHSIHIPPSTLDRDFGKLLNSKVGADVTLISKISMENKVREFPVHQGILCARSAVFEAMFSHDLKENRSRQVVIEDFDADTVAAMLHFIYTGQVAPELDMALAQGLLACADKYGLPRLSMICQATLAKGLTTENAAQILQLAYLHNVNELVNQTWQFIRQHSLQVVQTDGWKTLVMNEPKALQERIMEITECVAALGGK